MSRTTHLPDDLQRFADGLRLVLQEKLNLLIREAQVSKQQAGAKPMQE